MAEAGRHRKLRSATWFCIAQALLVPEAVLDGQVDGFAPHVLVRNDGGGDFPEELLDGVVCRVEVLYTDSMAARVSVGGRSFTIEDACINDLLALVDEAGSSPRSPHRRVRGRLRKARPSRVGPSPSIPLRRPPRR